VNPGGWDALVRHNILALGNTASVLSTISRELPNLHVAYPPNIPYPVTEQGDKCFAVRELAYPLSASLVTYLHNKARTYDLFHSELQYAPACLRAGVQFGIHVHGVTDLQLLFPETPLGKLLKVPYRIALAKASYVLCHEALFDKLRVLRGDVSVLQSPVDVNEFNPTVAPVRLERGITLFSPSRIDKWKGQEVVWAAVEMMRNRDLVKVFQSDWGWEPEFSRLKSTAPPQVRFIQVIPHARIASYFMGADVVVGQMRIGYPGLAELEAASCGVPVTLYSKDPESPFLPKTPDPQALSELLDKLIEDVNFRTRYAERCRALVLTRNQADEVAYNFAALVEAASFSGTRGYEIGLKDLAHLELGTGFEILERTIGRSESKSLRSMLLGL
jgi:glycosyltransferase involved in cell wall biosynthesis